MGKVMAKTAAERQREYRRNKLKTLEGEQHERIQAIVSLQAKRALDQLAHYYSVTQQEMLERVLLDARRSVISGLSSVDQDAFYDKLIKHESLQPNDSALQSNDQIDLPLQPNEKKKTGRKSKLSPEQCDEIRLRREQGESVANLAKEFGVAQNTIRSAINQSAY